ncbi:MAG: proteasome lid subunit RPN8/RPN11 [Myxococcota bacterium]|jgi:proteasome lid subunit RPN8/RPN11
MTPAEMLADPTLHVPLWAHADIWFPKECCALLLTSDAGPELILAENLADKYHTLDPEMYPRKGENAYILNPMLIQRAEDEGKRLVAIIHSHCIVGSYFSEEDVKQAMSHFDDGPAYPGVDYVVLDAQADGVKGFKTFAWSDATKAFVER